MGISLAGILKIILPTVLQNRALKKAIKQNPKAALTAFITATITLAKSYGYEIPPVWIEMVTASLGLLTVLFAVSPAKKD